MVEELELLQVLDLTLEELLELKLEVVLYFFEPVLYLSYLK